MAINSSTTLAEPTLPPDILAEMERLNREAAPRHIWLRTRANAPQKKPWHQAAHEAPVAVPANATPRHTPPPVLKPAPHLWKWAEILPYLLRIAEIAPLEFTDRQQFLLVNPTLNGRLQVTNTIRVAVSIYNPGDAAVTHMHTPNASRTILSNEGGYSTVEGEICTARRGDMIFTPNGTWHGHGNDSAEPVIWMDVLDWPLLETLDCVWIEEEDPSRTANTRVSAADYSQRHYGFGGMVPTFATGVRGVGQGNSPLIHYSGVHIRAMLDGLAGEDGDVYEGVRIDFTNPIDGASVFTTLGYSAQLLRPGETTLPKRETASTVYCVLAGRGTTDVGGQMLAWEENDIFVVPNHLWRQHMNADPNNPAVLYSVSDAPLLLKLGHYRAQGRTESGDIVALE